MKNDIWQHLGQGLVNINVYAQFVSKYSSWLKSYGQTARGRTYNFTNWPGLDIQTGHGQIIQNPKEQGFTFLPMTHFWMSWAHLWSVTKESCMVHELCAIFTNWSWADTQGDYSAHSESRPRLTPGHENLIYMYTSNINCVELYMSRSKTKPTEWPVRPAKTQISLGPSLISLRCPLEESLGP